MLFISGGFDGLSNTTNDFIYCLTLNMLRHNFKLYLLLDADDTAILAESCDKHQAALNSMFSCCQAWELEVNLSKNKEVTFNRRKIKNKSYFTYKGKHINVEDDFVYLAETFNHNGSF